MTRKLSSELSLLGRAGALGIIASGFATTTMAQSSETSVEFAMPAQSLDQALRNYGVVADKQVMFSVDLVNGKTVGPIAGEMTPDEALQMLLADTGLVFETTLSDVILIRTARQQASIMGGQFSSDSAVQDAASRQIESVDEKGDEGGSAVSEDEGGVFQQLEEIVVTGTNIRGVENPTTPVIQFDKTDIQLSGADTVEDFLRTIPQNFSSLGTATSFQGADPLNGSANNSTGGTAINLRGLGLGATLTLINGRRLPSTSGLSGTFVDISSIPLNAIERIDVQTDGASAIYGSDAVGGVVNFVTRKDYEGLELRARGEAAHGGGERYRFGVATGQTWETGGGFISLDYSNTNALHNADRDFIDTTRASSIGSLINKQDEFSVIGSLNQQIIDRLTISTDLLFASRNSLKSGADFAGIDTFNEARVDSLYANTRLDYAISNSLNGAFFFDYGKEESDTFDPEEPDPFIRSRTSDIITVEASLSGTLLPLPAGDLSFALGGLYREEKLSSADRPELWNAQRDYWAVYGELLAPIVARQQGVPLVQRFELSIAGRFEDYSDFGETLNPKFGVFWEINDDLAFRGTYSESFRAPPLASLAQIRDQIGVNAFPVFFIPGASELPQDPRLPPGTVATISFGGGAQLREETATIWSGGIDFTPQWFHGFDLSATYFDVAYEDRIESLILGQIFFNSAFAELLVLDPDDNLVAAQLARQAELGSNFGQNLPFEPTPSDIQVLAGPTNVNLSSRRVRGVDVIASYEREIAAGTLSTSLNLTQTIDFNTRLTPNSIEVDEVGTLYRPPKLRARGSVGYSVNGFTAFAALNYVDDYQTITDATTATPIDAWITSDVSLKYSFSSKGESLLDNTRLAVSIVNLFDEEPPFIETLDGLNFDTANANALGRLISLSLTTEF